VERGPLSRECSRERREKMREPRTDERTNERVSPLPVEKRKTIIIQNYKIRGRRKRGWVPFIVCWPFFFLKKEACFDFWARHYCKETRATEIHKRVRSFALNKEIQNASRRAQVREQHLLLSGA